MHTLIRRTETQVDLSGAGFRYLRVWTPLSMSDASDMSDVSHVMVLVHGYAEHSGRYDEMAVFFAKRGFAVYAFDQSGHGRSPGPRGDVDRFDRLPDEVAQVIEMASISHPDRPVVLVGHSMGGLVAAATALFRKVSIDRLVLSGALLEISQDQPKWKQTLVRVLAPLGSMVGLSAGIDSLGLSRDPEVGRRYDADPYVKDRMSARFAAGMLASIGMVRSAAARLDRPVLLLHGERDPISPTSGSQAFHESLSGDRSEDSGLRVYPELLHEIFQEPEREQIWNDVLEWLRGNESPAQS